MKKYKVTETESYRWAVVDKVYIVEANSKEEAREYVQNADFPLDYDSQELVSVSDFRGVDDINVEEEKCDTCNGSKTVPARSQDLQADFYDCPDCK